MSMFGDIAITVACDDILKFIITIEKENSHNEITTKATEEIKKYVQNIRDAADKGYY